MRMRKEKEIEKPAPSWRERMREERRKGRKFPQKALPQDYHT
jgi:hypothetical protein